MMHPRALRLAGTSLLIGGFLTLVLVPGAYSDYGAWAALDVGMGAIALAFAPGAYLFTRSRAGGMAAVQGTPGLALVCGSILLTIGSFLGSLQLATLPSAHGWGALITVAEDTALAWGWASIPGIYLVVTSPPLRPGSLVKVPTPIFVTSSGSQGATGLTTLTLAACPECHRPLSAQLPDGGEVRCAACGGRVGNAGGRLWSVPA